MVLPFGLDHIVVDRERAADPEHTMHTSNLPAAGLGGPAIDLTKDAGDDVQSFMGGDVWVMPALGGPPYKVAENGSFPAWSADGRSLYYQSEHKNIYRVPGPARASIKGDIWLLRLPAP